MLKDAVIETPLHRLKGWYERLFTTWFGGFFYNQIWEDPRVDRKALQLDGDSRMLTISSAGCNILNYLVDEPQHITAVDLNPHHIYLTRLKIAAIKHLPNHESFWTFFGSANSADNVYAYRSHLKDHIDRETREFWDGGSWMRRQVLGDRVKYFSKNLYNHARLGYFLRAIHWIARRMNIDPEQVLNADSGQQQEVFDRNIAPIFDHWLFRAFGRLPFFLYGLGIPPRQYEELRKETGSQLIKLFQERVRHLAVDYPVEDNYFMWQAFGRTYDTRKREAIPDYLKSEYYETIKSNIHKVQTKITTLTEFLRQSEQGSLNRFVFLDSQDWMDDDTICELWTEIARVGQRGSRIIFRTASAESPIEAALPDDLMNKFYYDRELSQTLHVEDRSAIYGGFHVYVMNG